MALPALADIEALATWLGREVEDLNEARAEAILAAASTLIRNYTGRVWVDGDGPEESATELQLDTVEQVTVRVAARTYENPNGATQQTTGPYSQTIAAWSSLGCTLSDDEKSVLPSGGAGIPGLSSIRVEAPARAAGVPRSSWWCDEEDEGS